MLALFDPSLPTTLETDTSDFITAAVLSQTQNDGILRPVVFMSRKMSSPECNYDIFDKKLLAFVNAFDHWKAELTSVQSSTVVLTDHKNLEYYTTTKRLNRRQVRWSEFLSEFDFKIQFRPGRKGGKPDSLTRISADLPKNTDDPREQHQYQMMLKPHQIMRCADAV